MERQASDGELSYAPDRRSWSSAVAPYVSISRKPPTSLSKEALSYIPQPPFERGYEHTQSLVERWLSNCSCIYKQEEMAPSTPRSASISLHHSMNRHRHGQGSQTSTRTKIPQPQTYRKRNMHHAGVHIGQLAELPVGIDEQVRGILGIRSWGDRVAAPNTLETESRFTGLAERFLADSKKNASDCSLEADWQLSLSSVVRAIADFSNGVVGAHATEKGKFIFPSQRVNNTKANAIF